VRVLRTVVDHQQDPGRRKAFDQRIEQSLALGVDPMQILEDQAEGLDPTLSNQHLPHALDCPPAARGGIERVPRGIVGRHLEQRQETRHHGAQPFVQSQKLARDLLSNLAPVVARLDREIASAQIDDRQVGGRLPIRNGAAFEHEAPVCPMRMDELPEET
jgi:hypothetical protein